MAGGAFALALAAHTLHPGQRRVDDVPLVGVHGFHLVAAAGAHHLFRKAAGQRGQVVLPLAAVAAHVDAQLHVGAFHPVDHQAGQIGQALHGLAAAADEHAHVLAGHPQNGGLALFEGGEGELLHAHQLEDGGQVLHRRLQTGVGGNVQLHLLVRDEGGLFGGLVLRRHGGLLLRRGGRLGHGGGGRLDLLHHFRLRHRHPHLGGNGAEQLAGGEFQHLIADVDVVPVHAKGGAGGLNGLLHGLGGHFHTAHVTPPSSAAWCARPCTIRRPAGGHIPAAFCSARSCSLLW